MERQERGDEPQHQEQPSIQLKCPRCESLDTKFRYFNNHSLAQPRYYCKTCKRQWTEGGSLRDVPIGGKSRKKQTRAMSSRYGNSRSQSPQPQVSSGEYLHNSHYLAPMTGMVSQNSYNTMIQPVTNLPATIYPSNSYHLNDEISCFDAIHDLIHSELINQPLNNRNQISSASFNMTYLQEDNVQSMAQQTLLQEVPAHVESYQFHSQVADNATSYQLSNNSLVQPTWPMDSLPEDLIDSFKSSTSSTCWWNNLGGSITDMEMTTTSIDPNQWHKFPNYGPT